MAIKKGDKVKVEYTGTLADGTVFDTSERHGGPLEFEAGAGKVIKGFDEALIGMSVGHEKSITLAPADAYGEHNPQMVQQVPRSELPADKEIKPGMMLMVGLPDGQQFPAKITDVKEDIVIIDFNHPLAGQTLHFKLKVVA